MYLNLGKFSGPYYLIIFIFTIISIVKVSNIPWHWIADLLIKLTQRYQKMTSIMSLISKYPNMIQWWWWWWWLKMTLWFDDDFVTMESIRWHDDVRMTRHLLRPASIFKYSVWNIGPAFQNRGPPVLEIRLNMWWHHKIVFTSNNFFATLLGLPFWQISVLLSWDLHQPESHQLSLQNLCQWFSTVARKTPQKGIFTPKKHSFWANILVFFSSPLPLNGQKLSLEKFTLLGFSQAYLRDTKTHSSDPRYTWVQKNIPFIKNIKYVQIHQTDRQTGQFTSGRCVHLKGRAPPCNKSCGKNIIICGDGWALQTRWGAKAKMRQMEIWCSKWQKCYAPSGGNTDQN